MKKLSIIVIILLSTLRIFSQDSLSLANCDSLSFVTCDSLSLTANDTISWTDNARQELTSLLDNSYFRKTQIGLMVYDLTADSIIFSHNEKQLLRPASTMKLITAITALDTLGSDYCYKTSISYTGKIEGNILYGDIYCKGGFDPMFDSKDMETLADSIKQLGIDSISGHIYGDVSMKDDKHWGEGWCWDDPNYTLTPLILNRREDFMHNFIRKIRAKDIVCSGEIRTGTTPSDATEIYTLRRSIVPILKTMMKESDNLYAESMLYQTAAVFASHDATAKDAFRHTRSIINSIGLDTSTYRFADGSGLSMYNYVTAELECMLLKYAYQKPSIYRYLYESLPVAGRDGTLKKRMQGTSADGTVHAKTGTLSGISSLSGYCTSSEGHDLCFAILNQGVMKKSEAHLFQNRICQILCR